MDTVIMTFVYVEKLRMDKEKQNDAAVGWRVGRESWESWQLVLMCLQDLISIVLVVIQFILYRMDNDNSSSLWFTWCYLMCPFSQSLCRKVISHCNSNVPDSESWNGLTFHIELHVPPTLYKFLYIIDKVLRFEECMDVWNAYKMVSYVTPISCSRNQMLFHNDRAYDCSQRPSLSNGNILGILPNLMLERYRVLVVSLRRWRSCVFQHLRTSCGIFHTSGWNSLGLCSRTPFVTTFGGVHQENDCRIVMSSILCAPFSFPGP